MAIPRRELRGHKCLRSGTPIPSTHQQLRLSTGHASNLSATPHRRVTAASHCTTASQPNRSTYPEIKPEHTDDRARCPDAQTTHRAMTTLRRSTPRSAGPRAAPPRPTQRSARVAPVYPLTHRRTPSGRGPHSTNPITTTIHMHSPHPKTPTQANLTPPRQAAHLQSMRTSYSFAQGGSRDNRGWPGHRHPETATPQAIPRNTGTQKPPRRT